MELFELISSRREYEQNLNNRAVDDVAVDLLVIGEVFLVSFHFFVLLINVASLLIS